MAQNTDQPEKKRDVENVEQTRNLLQQLIRLLAKSVARRLASQNDHQQKT